VQEETVLRDCGQRGVCRTPPGCARHWEERNRELVRENEVLRSNSDHLSSENASLASQVESMAMRIESLAEELAKPEDVRLREVVAALDGHAVIFDGLGARVGHLLDEMDEWIARAGESERLADERLAHANQLQADIEAESRASCSKADPASEDEESDIVVAGRQVPFVQVGMIVHPDDCLNCERDGNPLWCSALVCDIHDDDETARFGMMATLLFRNGERREEPCDELRRRWRLARDFDQARVYTGRWGAIPRGSVWPVAEVCEEA
jgi:hypothetical protein